MNALTNEPALFSQNLSEIKRILESHLSFVKCLLGVFTITMAIIAVIAVFVLKIFFDHTIYNLVLLVVLSLLILLASIFSLKYITELSLKTQENLTKLTNNQLNLELEKLHQSTKIMLENKKTLIYELMQLLKSKNQEIPEESLKNIINIILEEAKITKYE